MPPSVTLTMAGRAMGISAWNSPSPVFTCGVKPATGGGSAASDSSWKESTGALAPVRRSDSTDLSGTMISGSVLSRSVMAGLVSRIGGLAV